MKWIAIFAIVVSMAATVYYGFIAVDSSRSLLYGMQVWILLIYLELLGRRT